MSPAGVSLGPHDVEPVGLGRAVGALEVDAPDPDTIAARAAAWLREVLDDAGVALGAIDRDVLDALAEDWPTAQVVGGWVARAGGAS